MFGVAMELSVTWGGEAEFGVPLRGVDARYLASTTVFDGSTFRLHRLDAVIAFHDAGCFCNGGGRQVPGSRGAVVRRGLRGFLGLPLLASCGGCRSWRKTVQWLQ